METNLLWTGREYYSLEHCHISEIIEGVNIHSTIVGQYQEDIYTIEYEIKTGADWVTRSCHIKSTLNDIIQVHHLESDGHGNWKYSGEKAVQFAGCIDVDIPLTPFTNTLPIRRLKLPKGESKEISVIYCDLLAQEINPVRQRYTCLSATEYHYENVPNDFEATIVVDETGLVIDYPELFFRTARRP
jgi:hypothetical protein